MGGGASGKSPPPHKLIEWWLKVRAAPLSLDVGSSVLLTITFYIYSEKISSVFVYEPAFSL